MAYNRHILQGESNNELQNNGNFGSPAGRGLYCDLPRLPELITQGDSIDEALKNVEDAFATTLELYEHLGRPLPASIQIPDQHQPAASEPFQFETRTPIKSEDNSLEKTPSGFRR